MGRNYVLASASCVKHTACATFGGARCARQHNRVTTFTFYGLTVRVLFWFLVALFIWRVLSFHSQLDIFFVSIENRLVRHVVQFRWRRWKFRIIGFRFSNFLRWFAVFFKVLTFCCRFVRCRFDAVKVLIFWCLREQCGTLNWCRCAVAWRCIVVFFVRFHLIDNFTFKKEHGRRSNCVRATRLVVDMLAQNKLCESSVIIVRISSDLSNQFRWCRCCVVLRS